MIKAIFIQRISGTCVFFRVFMPEWKKKEIYTVLEGYFSAITTTVSEFGEIAPNAICFSNGDFIYYGITKEYILGIVSDNYDSNVLIGQINRLFHKKFGTICNRKKEDLAWEHDENCITTVEQKAISSFSRSLNLILSKKSSNNKALYPKLKEGNSEPLMISDVDLLISSTAGYPIYLMLSLNVLYEPTIFISFLSAIQELGKKIGLGLISQINAKNFVIYLRTSRKVMGILITRSINKHYVAYQQFLEFAVIVCENWFDEHNLSVDEVGELFEKRKEIESLIKLLVDSDTWELHLINEKERDLLASKTVNLSL